MMEVLKLHPDEKEAQIHNESNGQEAILSSEPPRVSPLRFH